MSYQKTSLNENVELKTDHLKQWQQKKQPWELSKLNIKKPTRQLEMGQKCGNTRRCRQTETRKDARRVSLHQRNEIKPQDIASRLSAWLRQKNSDTPKCWQGCSREDCPDPAEGEESTAAPRENSLAASCETKWRNLYRSPCNCSLGRLTQRGEDSDKTCTRN